MSAKQELVALALQSRDRAAKALCRFISEALASSSSSSPVDVAQLFKCPLALLRAGRTVEANVVLDLIQDKYLKEDGSVATPGQSARSCKDTYNLFNGYMEGWLCRAAHLAGRFDLSRALWAYVKSLQHPAYGGLIVTGRFTNTSRDECDLMSTAHLGMVALDVGDWAVANLAASYVVNAVSAQPDVTTAIWLRQDSLGQPVTMRFDLDMASMYRVALTMSDEDQMWFMLGLPIAFLAKMYRIKPCVAFREASDTLLSFFTRCPSRRMSSFWSHKVALACSNWAAVTKIGDSHYAAMCDIITRNLLDRQNSTDDLFGDPSESDAIDRFDQSAEMVAWLSEIAANIALVSHK